MTSSTSSESASMIGLLERIGLLGEGRPATSQRQAAMNSEDFFHVVLVPVMWSCQRRGAADRRCAPRLRRCTWRVALSAIMPTPVMVARAEHHLDRLVGLHLLVVGKHGQRLGRQRQRLRGRRCAGRSMSTSPIRSHLRCCHGRPARAFGVHRHRRRARRHALHHRLLDVGRCRRSGGASACRPDTM